jgi:hypothetical protein
MRASARARILISGRQQPVSPVGYGGRDGSDGGSPSMSRIAAVAAVVALVLGMASTPASARARVSIDVQAKVEAKPGRSAVISGKVSGAPTGAVVALQHLLLGHVLTVARAQISHGGFRLHLQAPVSTGTARIAVISTTGAVLAIRRVTIALDEAPLRCETPGEPAFLPIRMPAIVGEVIFPGAHVGGCGTGTPYTVTVESLSGTEIAQTTIVGRQSFAFELPLGSYRLVSGLHGECVAEATLSSPRIAHVNIVCPKP